MSIGRSDGNIVQFYLQWSKTLCVLLRVFSNCVVILKANTHTHTRKHTLEYFTITPLVEKCDVFMVRYVEG